MFWEKIQLNHHNHAVIEEIGKHMPGGFFIYKAEAAIPGMDRSDVKTIPIIAMTANVFDHFVCKMVNKKDYSDD